jgi:hypothetical protein
VEVLGKEFVRSGLHLSLKDWTSSSRLAQRNRKMQMSLATLSYTKVVFCWSLISDYRGIFKDQIHEIYGYLYDMGADPGAMCPVRRDAAWVGDDFAVSFQTKGEKYRRDNNPTVSDLAFYQLLRPEPSREDGPTAEDRCAFPLRIIPSVDMDFERLKDYSLDGGSAVGPRSRLLRHILRLWESSMSLLLDIRPFMSLYCRETSPNCFHR